MHECGSRWGLWAGFLTAVRLQGICRIECVRILRGTCMHECGSRDAVDGVCGRGFQMPFDCKASAELNAFVYF